MEQGRDARDVVLPATSNQFFKKIDEEVEK